MLNGDFYVPAFAGHKPPETCGLSFSGWGGIFG
jgi:hypothetical protein